MCPSGAPRNLAECLGELEITSRLGKKTFFRPQSPVPVSEIVWGEPLALSVILREATNVPFTVGLKTTEIAQLAPGAKVVPQLWVSWNDAELSPVMLIPAMVRFAVPGFCTAIVRLALDVPTVWVGKVRAEDEKDMSGTRGLIVKRTVFEIPPPGDGLVTVIDAVPLVATLPAGTEAVNTVLATKVVCRALPFHLTTEPSVKPPPFNVSWKSEAPFDTDEGARDCKWGTGLDVTGAARLLVRTYTACVLKLGPSPRNANPFVPQRTRLFISGPCNDGNARAPKSL